MVSWVVRRSWKHVTACPGMSFPQIVSWAQAALPCPYSCISAPNTDVIGLPRECWTRWPQNQTRVLWKPLSIYGIITRADTDALVGPREVCLSAQRDKDDSTPSFSAHPARHWRPHRYLQFWHMNNDLKGQLIVSDATQSICSYPASSIKYWHLGRLLLLEPLHVQNASFSLPSHIEFHDYPWPLAPVPFHSDVSQQFYITCASNYLSSSLREISP